MRITRNRVRCRLCGTVIESRTVHDFQRCACGAITTDGGQEYLARNGNIADMEDMTEYEYRDLTPFGVTFPIDKILRYDIEELLDELEDGCSMLDCLADEISGDINAGYNCGAYTREQTDLLYEQFVNRPAQIFNTIKHLQAAPQDFSAERLQGLAQDESLPGDLRELAGKVLAQKQGGSEA